MSDLLNQASLVMVPSGYKEDTVYSVVPSDGSGDLAFTRASNGTRINSAGLVEVTPWNLLDDSERFANWNLQGTSVSTDSTTAPNGTTTADTIIESNTTDEHNRFVEPNIGGGQFTYSVYLKKYNADWCALYVFNTAVGGVRHWVNLSTLTAGTSANIGSGIGTTSISISDVGNGWCRASILFNNPSGACRFYVANAQSNGGSSNYAGNGTSGVYVWGAQVNVGSTAKPYFPTTDRLNVPRLTYQNGGGGCPSLLLEKQSTNLQLYSQELDNAYWNTYNLTVTGNNGISPDGTQNADTLTFDANATARLEKPVGGTYESQTHTVSVYAKVTSGTQQFRLKCTHANVADYYSSDLTVTTEWQRFTFTQTFGASVGTGIVSGVINSSSGTAKSILFYGFQLEANSSYATSYIPTTSSSATRVADVATVNLPNTNMTFTAYLELDEAPIGTAAGDWFSIYSSVSSLGRAYGYANTFGFADAYNLTAVGATKMVWKQESGSTAKIFKGGALVGTSTTGTYTDPFNRLRIDGALLDKSVKIKQFVFFDNALTDAECIQLTA